MFQRLKGAIDSRIAEEQARQRQTALSVTSQRPNQQRRRPQAQNGSAGRVSSRQREQSSLQGERGPDPAEFEPEFAIGDDDSAFPSRIGTPKPEVKEKDAQPTTEGEKNDASTTREGEESQATDTDGISSPQTAGEELPTEVRVKLRKLDRLEAKYGELLKAYRVAHARIQVIEPFEASLRENTPLTSITDPGALVEYLNQVNMKGDMVLEELKRVTTEKEAYKKKSEEFEASANQLLVEVAEVKKATEVKASTSANEIKPVEANDETFTVASGEAAAPKEPASPVTSLKSPTSTSSRIPGFSMFSPRAKAMSPPPKEEAEDIFSYDSEVPKLEAEIRERQLEIEYLKKQVQNLKGDLAVARESTEGMVQSLETATRELHTLRDSKDKFDMTKAELEQRIEDLRSRTSSHDSATQELQIEIDSLKSERNAVSADLSSLNDRVDALEKDKSGLEEQLESGRKEANIINAKLYQKDSIVKDLEDSLAIAELEARRQEKARIQDEASSEKFSTMQSIMDELRTQLDGAESTITQLRHDIKSNEEELEKRPSSKVFSFLDRSNPDLDKVQSRDDVVNYLAKNFGLRKDSGESSTANVQATSIAPPEASVAPSSKKKHKKKKKGKAAQATHEDEEVETLGKASENLVKIENVEAEPKTAIGETNAAVSKLEGEISKLQVDIQNKNLTIDRLSKQVKAQDDLKEEIETLRDDLLHQGEEHVEARDALKAVGAERKALKEAVAQLEKELAETRQKLAGEIELEKSHNDTLQQLEELKMKSTSLQTDLSAAEQLASARFKDITDLRELLSKAQPELRSLRNEVAELKTAKEDLKNKAGELSRLEARHEDLKAEMKGLSKRLSDKDSETKELQQKLEQETSTRTRAEEDLCNAKSEVRLSEASREDAISSSAKTSKDLAKSKEEASSLRSRLLGLEDQIFTHGRQVAELKEELSLKSALHGSSQSLVQSLRDQTHELNTQAREASTRAENLEEELAEAQRMLSERTREGQTMRMLLNQAETGTESRIRDIKERMDAAIEERDRVEDEASVSSRRMMREVEDAKSKARDAQRSLKVLEDERDDLEGKQRDWKRRREELEQAADRATKEVEDVRAAMSGLREALDESERQVREIETQKTDLRKMIDEAKDRVEKLAKANKNLTEELKSAQAGARKTAVRPGLESGTQSSRTSIESSTARSPAPAARSREPLSTTSTSRSDTTTGVSQGTVDYVYLKNVLLQFLEQKDKSHQRQLIPVLAMLLHFDRKDEQKWMSAISTR